MALPSWAYKVGIIAVILVIIGALNWGWVGLTSDNPVSSVNNMTFRNETLERLLYVIIGIAGLYMIWFVFAMVKDRKA